MSTNIDIQQILENQIQKALKEIYQTEGNIPALQIQKTRKEFEGDLTLVTFPLLKISGKKPEETGQDIGEYLLAHCEEVTAFNVVKGFLNLAIREKYWLEYFKSIYQNKNFGIASPDSKSHVLVEYSSPNTNKPLHLGHLRNNFLGYSVAAILKAYGHKVTKVQIINDRGIHICKSMVAWQKFGNGETPESTGMKGDHLVGKYYVLFDKQYKSEIAELLSSGISEDEAKQKAPIMREAQKMLKQWEEKDADVYALWQTMNGWVYKGFETTYRNMGVDFDKLYYESDTYLLGKTEVEKGLQSGAFFQKEDGSIWVDLTGEGLDEKALLRKDGTAMYITQDIGTAILRFVDYPDATSLIYTVGNEQDYHFKVLFKILSKLGFKQADQCFHLSYGMVELPEGKMKSREGTVVDADEIMTAMKDEARDVAAEQGKLDDLDESTKEQVYHTIGMAALKYFLLRVDPVKNMVFNPRESIDFNGHTGPFIEYGYVRTRAIERKMYELVKGEIQDLDTHLIGDLHNTEKNLIVKLRDFPEVVGEAATRYNPSLIANYCFELIKEFNSFYHECPVLREENIAKRNFRVALSSKVGEVTARGMKMLGIDMVERM
ncbi:MAG: arginine--tRNA ligase [Flavobacteriales bacterium]|nr:arginine--tRNA ligase [Flavobacteriales bacterium]